MSTPPKTTTTTAAATTASTAAAAAAAAAEKKPTVSPTPSVPEDELVKVSLVNAKVHGKKETD